MLTEYVKKILSAKVYEAALESPLERAANLSARLNNLVLLKREDLQPVFSFKLRGAYNKIAQLSPEQQAAGVITASAGNHAQGVALSAQKLGIKAIIVMPETTPAIKVNSVKARQAQVVLHGDTFDEALQHSMKLVEEHGYHFVHPYDDLDVIAGQGTIGMEILRQHSGPIDAIFVPVGGGGLIAGISAYVKYLRPEIKMIGVEAEDSACLKAALEAGERVTLPEVGIFVDGVAVARVGEEPFNIARHYVDEVITVGTDAICAAIKDIFDDTRSIAEPAGALAVAGMKKYVADRGVTDKTLISIASGANMNFDRLRHISERTESGERREAVLAVTIAERPGSFLAFCKLLGKRNITEFNYRYCDAQKAHIFVGLAFEDVDRDLPPLMRLLEREGYPVMDMTNNEMAKLHIRYMVGGHAPAVNGEVLYRFEFPERPGALLRFLENLGERWNISLFHYRNHGAAFGRVLVGLQAKASEKEEVANRFKQLGYRFWEETENPAYRLFLG